MAEPGNTASRTSDGTYEARRRLMQLVFGGMAVHVVGTAARMNIAQAIGDEGAAAEDIAGIHGVPTQRMTRLLRALAALGLCAETDPGSFVLTEAGMLLRDDHPGSVRSIVRMFTDPVMLGGWPQLETAVRTGRTTFDDVFGRPFFEHLATEPELSALFNTSMSQGTRAVAAALPEAYDFDRYTTVTDVGGGDGTLLTAILGRSRDLHGVVFDTAEGAAQAGDTISAAGLAGRCTVVTGDFFETVPAGADLYMLKSIIHDWDDDRASTILETCRAALPADGRVLIIEPILPDTVPPEVPPGFYLSDLNMLVNVGGRERTRADFEHLCASSGLAVTAVEPLPPEIGFSLIEAVPA